MPCTPGNRSSTGGTGWWATRSIYRSIAGLPLFVNVPESMIHVKAALIEHA